MDLLDPVGGPPRPGSPSSASPRDGARRARVLRSFLQLVVAERLALRGNDPLDKADRTPSTGSSTSAKVGPRVSSGAAARGSLSRELFISALDLMANLGLLVPTRTRARPRRAGVSAGEAGGALAGDDNDSPHPTGLTSRGERRLRS